MAEKGLNIAYVGMRYDYGDPSRGSCYEYLNFLETLRRMRGVTVRHFPYDELLRRDGREKMNKALLETADWGVDLYFFVLFTDEIQKKTITRLAQRSGAITMNWFGDDHWRFHTFSKRWAPYFDWVVTTDPASVPRYHDAGHKQVIHSQWAFNHFEIVPHSVREDLDVTFVGQIHSNRRRIIADLHRRGVGVQCWGKGWKNGYLPVEEKIRTILRSRINLNFSSGSVVLNVRSAAKVFLNRRADRSIRLRSPKEIIRGARGLFSPRRSQIKGRTFEVPGFGGFLLSETTDELDRYYRPGEEIGVFGSSDELFEKVRYYLSNEEERQRVRSAGHLRTLSEHTYEARFQEIFNTMGVGQFGEAL